MSKKKEWSVDNRWGLDECLGLDKYKLTSEQRNECISLWNHFGEGAALERTEKKWAAERRTIVSNLKVT